MSQISSNSPSPPVSRNQLSSINISTMNTCPVQLVQVVHGKTSISPLWDCSWCIFLTHRRPHHPAAKDTIARWVKTVEHLSGVDIDIYKPCSCHSASTSCKTCWGTPGRYLTRWSMEILRLFLPPMAGRLNGQILLLLSPLLTVFWMFCLLLTNAMCISLLGVADSLVFGTIRVVPFINKICLYIVYIFLCWSLRQGLWNIVDLRWGSRLGTRIME